MRAYINLFFRFVWDSPTNPHLTVFSLFYSYCLMPLTPCSFFSMLVFISLRLQYMPPTCFVYFLFSSIPIFLCFPVPHNFTELHLHLLPATISSRLETHYIFIVFIVAKCTGDTLWRWIKWEKCCTRCVDALLCLHLNKFIPFCFDLMHYTGWGKGKK